MTHDYSYKVLNGSESGHCCFQTTVVDYKNRSVCECFDENDAETIRHALTTMQEITRALPVGVDPVKVVKGLAGEPSEEMQVFLGEAWYSKVRVIDDYNFSDCWSAMRAQLYREASEGAGE